MINEKVTVERKYQSLFKAHQLDNQESELTLTNFLN